MADKKTISAKSKGSLGIKSPKLSVNSSMLIDSGVKNAIDKNNFSVWKMVKYSRIKEIGKRVNQNKSYQIRKVYPNNIIDMGRMYVNRYL